MEGFIHISELGDDYFSYDEKRMSLTGSYSKKLYKTGSKISIKLLSIDLTLRQTQWQIIK